MKKLVALVVTLIGFCTPTFAQVYGTYGMVPTVQNGVVTLPIPGAPGLSINVATGTAATPLQNLNTDPTATKLMLGDDSGQSVPLGFNFPYFNQNFTNSIMYSNGIVNFTGVYLPGAGCCSGQDLRYLRDTTYNYSIMPLWTDLIDTSGNTTYYKRTTNSMTYGWYGTKEYGTNNPNTFELRIDSSGGINTSFRGAIVQYHGVTSGMTGDLSKGEYFQFFHNPNGGLNINTPTTWTTEGINFDQCASNPLSSTSCPTYQQAYHDQQCSINPLFAPDCPGYIVAFHDQQCSINPLYMSDCPGYAIAFHDQQCSVNQLSYTDCPGYAAAYLTQQCTASALYSPSCPGYQQAYFNQQCSINPLYNSSCPGYATAYHDQQCSINPLYATDCTGYQEAYQAQQFAQACRINPQTSPRCPGYVMPTVTTTTPTITTTSTTTTSTTTTDNTTTTTAVATPTVVATQTATQTQTNTTQTNTSSGGVVTTQSTTAPAAAGTVSASGTLSSPTAVPVIADPVVNNVISNNNQTTTAVTATSAVAQSTSPAPASSPTSPTSTTTTASTSSSSSSPSSSSSSSGSSGGSATQNTRAALVATLTRPGGAAGMSGGSTGSGSGGSGGSAPTQGQVTAAAGAAMKDADTAGSMEQQKAVQNVVIGAMSYVPGFDVYNVALRDVPFYKPYTIYGNQRTIDNRNAARRLFGATDEVHNRMVQEQFQLGN